MRLLPTTEPRKNTFKNVLHAKYLAGLLPPDRPLDKPYYRGDIYEDEPSKSAERWEGEVHGEYIEKIRRSMKTFPELGYLRDWMEVSTSLSRHAYLSESSNTQLERLERLQRTHVTQIDFRRGHEPKKYDLFSSSSLEHALNEANSSTSDPDARIYIIEDLSSKVIELLGSKFNIDPHFFRSHINDYMWNSVSGDAAERRDLDVVSRRRSHFMVQYLRPRYYKSTSEFEWAMEQTGRFNVLRQLDSDRSREYLMNDVGAAACLMRAKLSLWTRSPSSTQPFPIGILLVDPTPKAGHALWDGYTSYSDWESISTSQSVTPPRASLHADVVHWTSQLHVDDNDVAEIIRDPKTFMVPALKLMLSDWHHVVEYMTTQIGQIEWEIELPGQRKRSRYVDDNIMRKLHPWRRNMALYRAMVTDAMHRLYQQPSQAQPYNNKNDGILQELLPDFQLILDDIDSIQTHIAQLVSVATAFQSLDEGRRAMDQNSNVARLTYLATLFIPLSFVSGLLSMVPDVTQLRQTFWIFFVIAIPVTLVALVTADFLNVRKRMSEIFQKKEDEKGSNLGGGTVPLAKKT